MDDATRKAIEALIAPYPKDCGDPHVEALERLLACEAEHTTPVTPEWLDGAEAKRLGFERMLKCRHLWEAWRDEPSPIESGKPTANMVSVNLSGESSMLVFDARGEYVHFWNPTIAQVRAAVVLATGRR